ncbi:MoxR family ATPase [Sediminibacterium sp.]|uniref:AAA family ATPase n=1 Tax=Sediminibacterium sp. TaxID=1917865 RepID=UPI002732EC18|nr:MoxR family ATPase [Sediminibacterium sp.]MDP3567280.1 MoxR family ATPase [Sediminibacterium sp.]
MENQFENRIDLTKLVSKTQEIKNEISKYIVGQQQLIDLLLIALLADGHVLIEGVPGVAKTLTAKLLAKTIDTEFKRIQFTPDLMPSDIIGTSIFNAKTSDFEFKKGPLFANIVLTDEINRSPAKTQAALFEAMEERQITVDGKTYPLDLPFMVLATQNPIEQEGTYRLPEAQLDRFLFKIHVSYPSLEDESKMLMNFHNNSHIIDLNTINKIISKTEINEFKKLITKIVIEENLINYITQIVNATRKNSGLYLGASPRASIAILNSAKANACIQNRDFVTPDDIKFVAFPVLRHRIIITPEKEMEGVQVDSIIQQIIDKVEVPR